MNTHAWRLFRDRLATRDNLFRRGIPLNSKDCPCCVAFPESSEHLFVGFSTAREVGAVLKRWWTDRSFNAASVGELWDGLQYVTYFWELWKQRNEKVFIGKMLNISGIVNAIQAQVLMWLNARTRFGRLIRWDDWIENPFDSVCKRFYLAPR